MPGTLVGCPTRGYIRWETATRLGELDAPVLYQPGTMSVAITRNKLVKKFMETDYDTLLMVDDDVVPPPHILSMDMEDFAAVGVPLPMRHEDQLSFTVFEEAEDGFVRPIWPMEGLHEVDAMGTGCLMVKRDVFKELGSAPFRLSSDPDNLIGEDILFSRDIRALGRKVGCYWDGYFSEHVTVLPLSPVMAQLLEVRM